MGRHDREIGLELAKDLRSAGFDVNLAEAKLLDRITTIEQKWMEEKMRAQEEQFLRDCADLALDEDTGRCAEDESWVEWTAHSCSSSR